MYDCLNCMEETLEYDPEEHGFVCENCGHYIETEEEL